MLKKLLREKMDCELKLEAVRACINEKRRKIHKQHGAQLKALKKRIETLNLKIYDKV